MAATPQPVKASDVPTKIGISGALIADDGSVMYVQLLAKSVADPHAELSALLSTSSMPIKNIFNTLGKHPTDAIVSPKSLTVVFFRKELPMRAVWKNIANTKATKDLHKYCDKPICYQIEEYRADGQRMPSNLIEATVNIPIPHYMQMVINRREDGSWERAGGQTVSIFVKVGNEVYAPTLSNIYPPGCYCLGDDGEKAIIGATAQECVENILEMTHRTMWNTHMASAESRKNQSLDANMQPCFTVDHKEAKLSMLIADRKASPTGLSFIKAHEHPGI